MVCSIRHQSRPVQCTTAAASRRVRVLSVASMPARIGADPSRGGSGSTAQAPEKAVRTPAYETCVHRRACRVGEGRRTSPEGFPSDRRSTRPGDGAELEDGCDDAPGSPSGDGGSRSRRGEP